MKCAAWPGRTEIYCSLVYIINIFLPIILKRNFIWYLIIKFNLEDSWCHQKYPQRFTTHLKWNWGNCDCPSSVFKDLEKIENETQSYMIEVDGKIGPCRMLLDRLITQAIKAKVGAWCLKFFRKKICLSFRIIKYSLTQFVAAQNTDINTQWL